MPRLGLANHDSSTPDRLGGDNLSKGGNAHHSPDPAPTEIVLPVLVPRRVEYGAGREVATQLVGSDCREYNVDHAAKLFSLGIDGVAKLLVDAVENRDLKLISRILANIPTGRGETMLQEGTEILRAVAERVSFYVLPDAVKTKAVADLVMSDRSADTFLHGLMVSRILIERSPLETRGEVIVTVSVRCSMWPLRGLDLGAERENAYCSIVTGIIRDTLGKSRSIGATGKSSDPALPGRLSACGLLQHLPPKVVIAECIHILRSQNSGEVNAIALGRIASLAPQWKGKPPIALLENIGLIQEKLGNTTKDCCESALTILIELGEYGRKGVALAMEQVDEPRIFYRAVHQLPKLSAKVTDKAYAKLRADLETGKKLPAYADDVIRVLAKSGERGARYLYNIAVEANSATALRIICALAKSESWSSSLAEVTFICMRRSGQAGLHHGLSLIEDPRKLPVAVKYLEDLGVHEDLTSAEKVFYIDVIRKLGTPAVAAAFVFGLGQSIEVVRHDALKLVVDAAEHLDGTVLVAMAEYAVNHMDRQTRLHGVELAAKTGTAGGRMYSRLRFLERRDSDPTIRKLAGHALNETAPKSLSNPKTWPRAFWQMAGFR